MGQTMKALVYTAPNKLEFRDVRTPAPGSGEVQVSVQAVGICGSEIEGFQGKSPRRQPPLVMGHEFCGQVERVGPEVANVCRGDYVAVLPIVYCDRCSVCRRGDRNVCPQRELIGMQRPGAFAEHVVVPAHLVYPLPAVISPMHGALVEPLATAVHALARVQHELLDNVVLLGTGSLGLMCLQIAQLRGARRIIALDVLPQRLQVAQSLGATATLNPNELSTDQIREYLEDISSGSEVGLTLETVGTSKTRDLAISLTRPRGEVLLLGLHEYTSTLDIATIILKEIRINGSYAYKPEDFQAAIDLIAKRALRTDFWVTTMAFAEAPEAFRQLVEDPGKVVKIVLEL